MDDGYSNKLIRINDKNLTFIEKIAFCTLNFKKIGTGSSRAVFELNDNLVIKLARNNNGIVQNLQEIQLSNNYHNNDMLAHVITYGDDRSWIISENALKITEHTFYLLTNCFINRLHAYFKSTDKSIINNLQKNEEAMKIINFIKLSNLDPNDACRISSWGKIQNRIVLVDYGFTKK